MTNRFTGKAIVITGAAAGIGRETALLMAKEGGKLMLADLNETEGKKVESEIRAMGAEAHFLKTNVTKLPEIAALMDACVQHYGRIDIGINNAGVGGAYGTVEDYSEKDYDFIVDVNQKGVFFCMQEEIKRMKTQGEGVIVNTASMAGLVGSPYSSVYVASKHAVVGMTKSAALENTRFNIRVNAVCPAFTMTNMVQGLIDLDPAYAEKLKAALPMRRFGTTVEIANAIAYLSSSQSSFNTGLCLPVDGGLVA